MVDPVPTISGLAIRHNLPLHVDACFGGFMLPWVEKLGYSLPEFDFRLPGVTSMSADIHKYGLGIKASTSGSSVAFQFHLVTSLFRSAGGECGTVPG
ncbi:Sphingosine-1-phosphate lyase 1, partial [Geodia barretti]